MKAITKTLQTSMRALCIAVASLPLAACTEHFAGNEAPEWPAADYAPAVAVARGEIGVDGGVLALSPGASGIVSIMHVREGDRVEAGDLLVRQTNASALAAVQTAMSELHLAQTILKGHEARLPGLRRTVAQYDKAAQAGAGQPQRADEAAQRLRQALSDVAIGRAHVAVSERQLDQAKAALTQLDVIAPTSGTIVSVKAQQGGYLAAGEQALSLLPDRARTVRAEVNAAFAMHLCEGMTAEVVAEIDGADSPLPGARLVYISPVFSRQGQLQDDTQRGPVPVVNCILEFDAPVAARVGQHVRVIFHSSQTSAQTAS